MMGTTEGKDGVGKNEESDEERRAIIETAAAPLGQPYRWRGSVAPFDPSGIEAWSRKQEPETEDPTAEDVSDV